MSIIIAILILGFIVFIHELGHFVVAKSFMVPIREFSIGMGPRILSKVVKNTRYSLKAFPFGGSCAMIGEDIAGSGDFSFDGGVQNDDGTFDFDGVIFTRDDIEKNNFSVISPVKKFLICLAGPFANFILALVCAFFLVSILGFDIPIISDVQAGSGAYSATPYKVEAGDRITALEIPGEKTKVRSYRDISLFMQLNNDEIVEKKLPIILTLERKERLINTVVYPQTDIDSKRAIIGVSFKNIYVKPKTFIEKCKFAIDEFFFYIDTTIKSLRLLVGGKLTVKEISGPIGTVAIMGDAINDAKTINVESTICTVLMLIVLISANLGVMNLLPIPALDGGRIVFAAIEMITGSKYNKKLEMYANTVTMIFLLMFMMWIFGMDIYKLMMGR